MKCAAVVKTTVSSSPCFVLCNAALSYVKILSKVISYEAEEAKTHMERSAGKAFNTREVERCRRFKKRLSVLYKSASLHGLEITATFVQKSDM